MTTADQLVQSGDLDRKAGRDLQRRAAGIAVSIQNGRHESAVERLHDLDKRLRELREDDDLSRAGFAALDVIDPIIDSLE
ncbi:FIMAH domain-containing protein [Phytohabitans flavus]|uniref:FIMAH domain-containing protein n=1 Tax=Phytohabitans flavus TaxID=1076124 RepID=UPI00363E0554